MFQRCLLSPSSLLSPLDARKNFLIDSAREYTVFSSFLLVSFFPARLPARKEEGKWSCRAYRSPLLGLYRGRNARRLLLRSSLFFFSLPYPRRNRCRSEHRIRVIRAANFVFQQGRRLPPTFLRHFLTLSKKRRWGGGRGRDTRYRALSLSLSLSVFQPTRSECRAARAAVASRFPVVSYPRRGK